MQQVVKPKVNTDIKVGVDLLGPPCSFILD